MKNTLSLFVLLSLPALAQAYSHGISGSGFALIMLFLFWPAIAAIIILITALIRHIKQKPTKIWYIATVVLFIVQGVWLLVAESFI